MQILILSNFVFSLFILLTIVIQGNSFRKFDTDFTTLIQSKADTHIDSLLSLISNLGKLEISLIALFVLFLVLNKKQKILVLMSFGFMHVVEIFLKFFIDHSGPPFQFYRYEVGELLASSHTIPGFSYPSGNTARATFIFILILYLVAYSKKLSFIQKNILISLVVPLYVLVVVSRVYLGEHWISDVFGGVLLGLAFSMVVFGFSFGSRKKFF